MTCKTQSIFYLIIVAVVFGGCSLTPPNTAQPVPTYLTTSPTPEYSLLTPTTTPVLGISLSPTPEYPLQVTPHVTPLSTRLPADIIEELGHMLQTNGNCALPCFWGIQPDQTRYEELYDLIDRLGGRNFFDILEENGHLRVSSNFRFEKGGTIRVDLIADLQDDVVKDLKVTLLNQLDTGITPDAWSAYNLDKILITYGVPDMVDLYSGTPYNALTFFIRLKFGDNDTSILYFGITTETDKYLTPSNIIFCPEEIGIDTVVMWMGKHPFNEQPDGVPLSKATGLDEQAFHKLFTENPSACLALNRDAMP
jgi:hypothetical protein